MIKAIQSALRLNELFGGVEVSRIEPQIQPSIINSKCIADYPYRQLSSRAAATYVTPNITTPFRPSKIQLSTTNGSKLRCGDHIYQEQKIVK